MGCNSLGRSPRVTPAFQSRVGGIPDWLPKVFSGYGPTRRGRVLPHPGPLPLGEGESQLACGDDERVRMVED